MTAQPIHDNSERKYEVTPLELLFDLVFAFALSQLSHHLLPHLSWRGAAETMVMLVAIFAVWFTTSWSATLIRAAHRSRRNGGRHRHGHRRSLHNDDYPGNWHVCADGNSRSVGAELRAFPPAHYSTFGKDERPYSRQSPRRKCSDCNGRGTHRRAVANEEGIAHILSHEAKEPRRNLESWINSESYCFVPSCETGLNTLTCFGRAGRRHPQRLHAHPWQVIEVRRW